MDLLKQNLAPIPTAAWTEIIERATNVIKLQLSTRKALTVKGPFGIEKSAIFTGRMKNTEKTDSGLGVGVYDVQPLVETRITFSLPKWELDNVLRGAKDLNLEALDKAAEEIALYEENSVYNGNPNAGIAGIEKSAKHKLKLSTEAGEILQNIAEGVLKLKDSYIPSPYNLVVSDSIFKALTKVHNGKLLLNVVKTIINGEIIRSKSINGAVLIPQNNSNLELTIGQDYSIGYEAHDSTQVKLFITNSFTFRVLDNSSFVYYTL